MPLRGKNGLFDFSSEDLLARELNTANLKTIQTIMAWNDPTCPTISDLPCSMETDYKLILKKTVERYDGDDDFGCVVAAPDCYAIGDNQYPSEETKEAIRKSPWKNYEIRNEPDNGAPFFNQHSNSTDSFND